MTTSTLINTKMFCLTDIYGNFLAKKKYYIHDEDSVCEAIDKYCSDNDIDSEDMENVYNDVISTRVEEKFSASAIFDYLDIPYDDIMRSDDYYRTEQEFIVFYGNYLKSKEEFRCGVYLEKDDGEYKWGVGCANGSVCSPLERDGAMFMTLADAIKFCKEHYLKIAKLDTLVKAYEVTNKE